MSYTSENRLPPNTSIAEVQEFVELMNYKKRGAFSFEGTRFIEYYWFDEDSYHSWSAIDLTILVDKETDEVIVSTCTNISRSYYDLTHQNKTISCIRKRFGGTFKTDEGIGRYLRPRFSPPPPASSGCHLAFCRFGRNLIKVLGYLQQLKFENEPERTLPTLHFIREMSPRTLSNNMIISFLVSIIEDYLKS